MRNEPQRLRSAQRVLRRIARGDITPAQGAMELTLNHQYEVPLQRLDRGVLIEEGLVRALDRATRQPITLRL